MNPYNVTAHGVDPTMQEDDPDWKDATIALEMEDGTLIHLDPYRLKLTLEALAGDHEMTLRTAYMHNNRRQHWILDEPHRVRMAIAAKRQRETAEKLRQETENRRLAREEEQRQRMARQVDHEAERRARRRLLMQEHQAETERLKAELKGDA